MPAALHRVCGDSQESLKSHSCATWRDRRRDYDLTSTSQESGLELTGTHISVRKSLMLDRLASAGAHAGRGNNAALWCSNRSYREMYASTCVYAV